MVVSEVPAHVLQKQAKNCLIFQVDSYTDVLNVLSQVDQYKLSNLKIGSLDTQVVTNLNVREGQRVLAVEFVGEADNSLKQDRKCLSVLDCHDKSYNAHTLFNKAIQQQHLAKRVSLCVIKPHIVKSHLVSKVVSEIIEAGFDVSSLELITMNKMEVDEIFEV